MGVKTRKYVRHRNTYDPAQFDQYAVDPDEIPADAPTHCAHCKDVLTPLRRLRTPLDGRIWCTADDCVEAATKAKTENWRMVNLAKQGEELVIAQPGQIISTSKRGI